MAGFTTTDDGGWVFKLGDDPEIPDLPAHDPIEKQEPKIATYLNDPDKWKNYSDLIVYELESLLRKFFEQKLEDPGWTTTKTYWRRYTCGLMFEQLYGRKASQKNKGDITRLRRLTKVLAYYSTKIQKAGMIRGKNYTKTVYTLSLKLYKKRPPYSLRLRLQWLTDKGIMPTWHNMQLPKDDLKPGHARNPKTDENMRIRRERAKQRYNEKYHKS